MRRHGQPEERGRDGAGAAGAELGTDTGRCPLLMFDVIAALVGCRPAVGVFCRSSSPCSCHVELFVVVGACVDGCCWTVVAGFFSCTCFFR